jgi:hypothetical protein
MAFEGPGAGVMLGAVVLAGGAVVLDGVGAVFFGVRGAGCSNAASIVCSIAACFGTARASDCSEAFFLSVPVLLWLASALSKVSATLVSAPVSGASC